MSSKRENRPQREYRRRIVDGSMQLYDGMMKPNWDFLFVVNPSFRRNNRPTKQGYVLEIHYYPFSGTPRRFNTYTRRGNNSLLDQQKKSFVCVHSPDQSQSQLNKEGDSLVELKESAINSSRSKIRIAIPSKGDIGEETRSLLKDSGMEIRLLNPRQYWASVKDFPEVEVWLQRPADIVRRVQEGQVDIGFVGYDVLMEYQVSVFLKWTKCYLLANIYISFQRCHFRPTLITLPFLLLFVL